MRARTALLVALSVSSGYMLAERRRPPPRVVVVVVERAAPAVFVPPSPPEPIRLGTRLRAAPTVLGR